MRKGSFSVSEGRAILARPSLRLLLVTGAMLFPALVAASARAEEPEPIALTETNPLSTEAQPAASTEPFVIGRGDGAIATVVNPFGGRVSSPIAAAVNPDNLVAIYANDSCAAPVVAGGTIDELEGKGIQVEVEPNSTTIFSAIQIDPNDPGHPSICSKPLTYWSGSGGEPPAEEPPAEEPPAGQPEGGEQPTPKPPATTDRPATAPLAPRLRTAPAGPANDNTPRVLGAAAGEVEVVKIFANSSCSGAPVATPSPAQLAAGVEVKVPDDSTTDFTGIAVAHGKQSFCSPPATYIEDSSPPHTRITMGPGAKTRHRKVVFRFADTAADPRGTSFVCKVDRHKWKTCRSPFKLKRLAYGHHSLRVIGADPIGNVEAKAVKRNFKVIH